MGLQSVAGTGCLRMGLGRGTVVWLLRSLLRALSGVSDGCILADGLLDCGELASGLCGAAGGGCRRRQRGTDASAAGAGVVGYDRFVVDRSEEHTSELQSL